MNKFTLIFSVLLFLVIVVLLAACGRGGGDTARMADTSTDLTSTFGAMR